MDATESPLSTSPSTPSSFSPQRHFYLAVDRPQFKMETLLDLLGMVGRRPCLPIVVCCSSRDELDSVCSNISNLSSRISISSLYSDLLEADRARILDDFRQATVRWNKLGREKAESEAEKEEERKSHLIVVTDTCLPLLGSTESPVSARILINYELPTKKETYMRRMATSLSSDGIVINMVVGGEVVLLKSLEESSGLVIAEMPIHIFEMITNVSGMLLTIERRSRFLDADTSCEVCLLHWAFPAAAVDTREWVYKKSKILSELRGGG